MSTLHYKYLHCFVQFFVLFSHRWMPFKLTPLSPIGRWLVAMLTDMTFSGTGFWRPFESLENDGHHSKPAPFVI